METKKRRLPLRRRRRRRHKCECERERILDAGCWMLDAGCLPPSARALVGTVDWITGQRARAARAVRAPIVTHDPAAVHTVIPTPIAAPVISIDPDPYGMGMGTINRDGPHDDWR